MKIKELITDTLKAEPQFRERSRKDKGIVSLLIRKYKNVELAMKEGFMTRQDLIDLVQDYSSMDRAWRQALEQNPELRGSDYQEKERLEQEKQIELGYGK